MNRAVYKHILATYGRRWGIWLGMGAELVQVVLLRIVAPIVVAVAATRLAGGDVVGAREAVWWFLVVYTVGPVVGIVGDLVAIRTENDEYGRLLSNYHMKLTSKDMAFYRDHQTGYLTGLFRQYMDSVLDLVRLIRGDLIGVVVSLVVPVIVLMTASWRLGLVSLVIVAVQLVYVVWASSRANNYRQRSHEIYRKVTGEVADEITNIVAFKAAGMERAAQSKVRALAREEIETFWLRRRTAMLLDLPRTTLTALGVTGAFLMVVGGMPAGARSAGLVVLTTTYMFQIVRNVAQLPGLIIKHDDLVTKAYPTFAYLESVAEEIRDPEQPQKLAVTKGAIEIDGVDFSYPAHGGKGGRIAVFEGLAIGIAGGEQVGVVGLSGAGKSTLASLLMRFDDVTGGVIRIDGTDIRAVAQSDLRRKIAYVPQEPLLFHTTVRENIMYGRESASEAEVRRAARAAHAAEFIERLPDGYDTVVGERGVKLSGGQKQRLVIARAVLKNAPIMIFDEATSALDSESEQIIQRALPEIIGKRTAVIIAHRLSTVAGLDRIIVMHAGRIEEQGSHEELLAKRGRYWGLWQKQTAGEG